MRISHILAIVLSAALSLEAQIIVDIGGSGQFTFIQNAILAAPSGSTILVLPGVYPESINFNGKALTIVSQAGPNATIIDATSLQPANPSPTQPGISAVYFVNNERRTSVIRGFTISGGSATPNTIGLPANGGGICCIGSSPTIDGNIITQNGQVAGMGRGGGIYCENGSPLIVGNSIITNVASEGGGICSVAASPVIVTNTGINFNQVDSDGGGIFATGGGSLIIDQNTIVGNFCPTGSGGGILIDGLTKAIITNNSISVNQVFPNGPGGGGGIFCRNTGLVTLQIVGNLIANNHSELHGGGINCIASSPLIDGNNIPINFADGFGGGIHLTQSSNATVTTNFIGGSNLAFASGGGIAVRESSNPLIAGNQIIGNRALNEGGGVFISDSNPIVKANTISQNGIPVLDPSGLGGATQRGGGVFVTSSLLPSTSVTPSIGSNTIESNFAEFAGAGIGVFNANPACANNRVRLNGSAIDPLNPPSRLITQDGGGLSVVLGGGTYNANLFLSNEADNSGAGCSMSFLFDPTVFTNNIVAQNWLHVGQGAGFFGDFPSLVPTFVSNTITHNINVDSRTMPTAFGPDSAMHLGGGSLDIWNSIIRGDTFHAPMVATGFFPSISFSNFGPLSPLFTVTWLIGPGTIDAAPRYVNPGAQDFHLQSISPCRNTGSNFAPFVPTGDIDNQARINAFDPLGVVIDMGADEF